MIVALARDAKKDVVNCDKSSGGEPLFDTEILGEPCRCHHLESPLTR
jgi:hypothetical protein